MQTLQYLLLVASLAGHALGVPFTQLTDPSTKEELGLSAKAINSIKKIVEKEVYSNVLNAYLGLTPELAATSCKEIADKKPSYQSGYYWVKSPAGPLGVYCEMAGEFEQDGGWMRVAGVDMRETHTQCPQGFSLNETTSKRTCTKSPDQIPGCASITFPVHSVPYNKVCGKIIGYQAKNTNGFGPAKGHPYIDQTYVDGVSITHGMPRQHIWTLVSTPREKHRPDQHIRCPCMDFSRTFNGVTVIPSFVGNDYYCETGNRGTDPTQVYTEDPLWDGKGCKGNNMCCERGGPWFCKDLDSTTRDDIEVRVCTNNPQHIEDILLEEIHLYTQ